MVIAGGAAAGQWPGAVHPQLHDSLYGMEQDVGSNTVNVHVHNLRKKLGAEIIETVRGMGFRLGSAYCRQPS